MCRRPLAWPKVSASDWLSPICLDSSMPLSRLRIAPLRSPSSLCSLKDRCQEIPCHGGGRPAA